MHVEVFQALPGHSRGSRGLQGPPEALRGLQKPPGPPKPQFEREFRAPRVAAREYTWDPKVCRIVDLLVMFRGVGRLFYLLLGSGYGGSDVNATCASVARCRGVSPFGL